MYTGSSLWKKFNVARQEGRLFSIFKSRLRPYRFLLNNPAGNRIHLHCPDYVKPNQQDQKLVKRIFKSYRKMCEDFDKASVVYKPSTLWKTHIERDYKYLIDGSKCNDMSQFHFFWLILGHGKVITEWSPQLIF